MKSLVLVENGTEAVPRVGFPLIGTALERIFWPKSNRVELIDANGCGKASYLSKAA